MRDGNYRRVQIQSRTQQNSLYELEYSPKGRSSDYYHPRKDYFREEYHQPECQSPECQSPVSSLSTRLTGPHTGLLVGWITVTTCLLSNQTTGTSNIKGPPSDTLTRKNQCTWEGKVVQKATTSTNKGEKELQALLPDKFLPEDMGLLTKGLKGKDLVQGEIGSTTGQIKGEYIHQVHLLQDHIDIKDLTRIVHLAIQELEKVIQLNTSQDTEKVNLSLLIEGDIVVL